MSQNDEDFVLFAQESSLPLAFSNYLQNWVVQRQEGKKPSFLTQEEINHLAFLSVSCLRQRALGQNSAGAAWAPLLPLLGNWVVQRHRGEAPSKLTTQDCQALVRLVLKALVQPIYLERNETSSALKSEVSDDPLHFLREHLSYGL